MASIRMGPVVINTAAEALVIKLYASDDGMQMVSSESHHIEPGASVHLILDGSGGAEDEALDVKVHVSSPSIAI